MELTKQQRHEIYKRALDHFKEVNSDNDLVSLDTGLCYSLACVTRFDISMYDFPEIIEQKPKKCYERMYWFPFSLKGRQKRIEILQKAIELTKE